MVRVIQVLEQVRAMEDANVDEAGTWVGPWESSWHFLTSASKQNLLLIPSCFACLRMQTKRACDRKRERESERERERERVSQSVSQGKETEGGSQNERAGARAR